MRYGPVAGLERRNALPLGTTTAVAFTESGFELVSSVLSDCVVELLSHAADELIDRYKHGDATVVRDAVSVSEVTTRYPDRNPGVERGMCLGEPFVIGDLLRHDLRFVAGIDRALIWTRVGECLAVDATKLVFHFCNLTVKPARVGPGVGWHRDRDNTFMADAEARTVRVLLPLDPMDEWNGGTAIAVGSHVRLDSRDPSDFDVVVPAVAPGQALVLSSGALHGGGPNRTTRSRRLLVVQFGIRDSALTCFAEELHSMSTLERIHDLGCGGSGTAGSCTP